jgi:hypothetical protein
MKKFIGVVLSLCLVFGLVGSAFGLSAYRDELINGMWTFENNVTFLGDIAGGGSLTLNGVEYTWPAADGTAGYQLTTDGAGTLSWAAAGAACPWDDLAPPDANESLDHTVFWTAWDFGDTDHDMFTIQGSDAFGDVSIVKIEQTTGDPTDGTVLEVVSADTDADALVVTANSINSIVVAGDGDVDILGGTGAINYTDFDVSDDGAVTIASDADNTMITLNPSIATTLAIDATAANIATALSVGANDIVGTTGLINYTNFDVDAAGAVVCTALDAGAGTIETTGDLTIGGTADIGTLAMDALVAATAATTITLDGTEDGGVTLGGTSTGTITLGADGAGATLVNLPNTVDMTLSGGDFAVTDTANADMVTFTNNTMTTADLLTLTAGGTRTSNNVIAITDAATTASTIAITANTQTSGHGIKYSNSGAGLTGAAIDLEITDGAGFLGDYIRCYDGGAEDFTMSRYGVSTWTGKASTDMIVVTAGDVQVDDGKIEIDTDEDDTTKIERAQATVTGPVVSIVEQTDTVASAKAALFIDQDTDSTPSSAIEVDTEGAYVMKVDALVAAGDGIYVDVADSYTGQWLIADLGPWIGTTNEGFIHVTSDSAATVPAGQFIHMYQAGTGQHAGAIAGTGLWLSDEAAAPAAGTSYLVYLDGNNIEAMHVDTGDVQIDDNLIVDTKITVASVEINTLLDVNEDITIDFNAADEEVLLTNSAEMDDGLAQVTIYNSDADLTDGDLAANMYLLRLKYVDDADPDGAFLSCEDNDGDEQFIIDAEGATTMEGTLTVNGPQIVGDGATEMVGVINDVVDGAATNPYTVTAAMSGTVFYNSQAIEFDLPDAATGLEYTFVVGHASNLDVDPAAGDTINYSTCGAGDKVRSATVGDTITVIGTDAGNWFVKSIVAGDGDFTDTVWTDAGA